MVWTGTAMFLTDHIAISMHKKVCQSLENYSKIFGYQAFSGSKKKKVIKKFG